MKTLLLLIPLLLLNAIYAQPIPYNTTPDWISGPTVNDISTGLGLADINGDGWKDIVIANGNDILRQTLVVYYNNGDGTFPQTPSWQSADIDYCGHLAIADVNKDGWLDVAVSVYLGPAGFGDPGKVKLYLNTNGELDSNPGFVSEPFYTFSCAFGDADGDGDPDLACVAGEPYSSQLDYGKIFFNDNGTFSNSNMWNSVNLMGPMDVDFGDFDLNGHLDLAFVCEDTPNYIYLGSPSGISTDPAWQSIEGENYMNSLDIGFTRDLDYPSLVATGNDQMGGDGRVRLYTFDQGVPGTSQASWLSEPNGYGSGVLLADINLDGINDLLYGGWWQPLLMAMGNSAGFGLDVSFTSATSSVIEAIMMADLDRDHILLKTDTIEVDFAGKKAFYLSEQLTENILEVRVNDEPVSSNDYCYIPNKNWITLGMDLDGGDEITVTYEYSDDGEIVISNWDNNDGNYIFYNQRTYTKLPETEQKAVLVMEPVWPNPADEVLYFCYELPLPAKVSCSVDDLCGRVLLQVDEGIKVAGKHSSRIDICDLNPGIYMLKSRIGERIFTQKFIVN